MTQYSSLGLLSPMCRFRHSVRPSNLDHCVIGRKGRAGSLQRLQAFENGRFRNRCEAWVNTILYCTTLDYTILY